MSKKYGGGAYNSDFLKIIGVTKKSLRWPVFDLRKFTEFRIGHVGTGGAQGIQKSVTLDLGGGKGGMNWIP